MSKRGDILIGIGLLLVAAFFRLYRIHEIPFGFWIDEISNARNAALLGAQNGFHPFGMTALLPDHPNGAHTTHLYLYFCWIILKLSNFSPYGVKLISVLPGIAAPPLLYLLLRRFFSTPVSTAAAFLFAVSAWHVTLSRWGWDEVLLTTLVIAVFWVLTESELRRSKALAVCAGAIMGVSLYTYLASRLALLAVTAFYLLRRISQPKAFSWRRFALFSGAVVTIVFPLVLFWLQHPGVFNARTKRLSIVPWLAHGDFSLLFENLQRYILMFHFLGDHNPRHQFNADPQLDFVSGILFAVGMLIASLRWRRLESQMAWVWFAAGMLGGLLSFPDESPQAYRTGMIAPACFVFVAISLGVLEGRVKKASLPTRRVAAMLLVLCCLTIAVRSFKTYFIERPRSQASWKSTEGGAPARLILEDLRRRSVGDRAVLIDRSLWSLELDSELRLEFHEFESETLSRVQWLQYEQAAQILSRDPKAVYYARPDQHLNGEEIQNPFGAVYAVVTAARTSSTRTDALHKH